MNADNNNQGRCPALVQGRTREETQPVVVNVEKGKRQTGEEEETGMPLADGGGEGEKRILCRRLQSTT